MSQRNKVPLAGLVMALALAACNSQPAKYRHSNDCKCPKWNHVPRPPAGSEHAGPHPAATPYHCGTAQPS